MTRRIRKEYAVDKKGWSRWVQPKMRGYLMACCDCGLVHEMQFQAVRQTTKANSKGYWKYEHVSNGRVSFRARRAPLLSKRQRAKQTHSHTERV